MPQLRLASYNIHLCIGRDGEFDPSRIARVIQEIDADVIALQEIAMGGGRFDMLRYLGEECGLDAIAGPTLVSREGEYGNAILSRLPVAQVRRWNLSVGRHEPRGAIDAILRCGTGSLRVVATHLGLLPGERRKQIRLLIDIVRKDNRYPTVLLGDLNEWFLWGRPLRWMHRYFQSTPAPATFPSGHPLFALDRIWVEPRRALSGVAAHASALARVASDHLPLVAGVQLAEAVGADRAPHARSRLSAGMA